MKITWAEQEMMDGYFDGRDLSSPEPSDNRSMSYRHGFANGRDDRRGSPRATADVLRKRAEEYIAHDNAMLSVG